MKLSLCIDTTDEADQDYPCINKISEILEHELENLYPASKNYENAEISITLVKPEEIRTLNHEYRNVDEATDVLSFPMEFDESEILPVLMLGDIIICPDEVSRLHPDLTSQEAMCLMIAHSFLHLLGYDHDTQEKEREMWRIQDEIKAKLLEGLR